MPAAAAVAKPPNRLPDRSADARRDAALRECLREYATRHAGDQLVATVLPHVAALIRGGTKVVPRTPSTGASSVLRLYEDAKARSALRTPVYGAGDGVVAIATVNQARALRGLVRELGPSRRLRTARPSWRRVRALSVQARARGNELAEAIDRDLLPREVEPLELLYSFYVGSAMLALAEQAVSEESPRVALIGSSHGLASRALAYVARDRGVASVYVPHAPVLADQELVDLPVDYAVLRGPAELECYAAVGVDPKRLDFGGDTSIDRALAPTEIDSSRPAVFAPSPDPAHEIHAMVALIAAATSEPIVVSPHPRSDVHTLRAVIPASWSIWEGRTLDLLRQGTRTLIQRSSGVALEALQLGISVVELSFPGDTPRYLFIREPFVRVASDVNQLQQRLQEPQNRARADVVAWAKRWVASAGPEAISRASAVIERARREGPMPGPIWDAWSGSAGSSARVE